MKPSFKPPPRGEDLPYSDGEPMESERHVKQAALLYSTLTLWWADRQDVYVATNMFVYFSETQAKRNDFRGPDLFVVMDTVKRERKSWVVWEEEGRTPSVVIELLSESTASVDRGEKKRIYARSLHVPEYYLFDPFTAELEAFELDRATRTYRRREPGLDGRYASQATSLSLGTLRGRYFDVEADWLRWFSADGSVIPTDTERAEAANQRAEAALRRVAELEALLAK